MKFSTLLCTALLLTRAALAADTLTCALPLDVVQLDHDARQSLEILFHNAGLDGTASATDDDPLGTFWTTWNQSSLARTVRTLTSIQKISFDQVVARPSIRFHAVYDSTQAIQEVASGKLALAWVEGDTLRDTLAKGELKDVRTIAIAHSYFAAPSQELFVLVARVANKYAQLGTLDKDGLVRAANLIKRGDLHFGYGSAPDEALRPFREAAISPFPAHSSLGPNLYVTPFFTQEYGIEQVVMGGTKPNGTDVSVVDPGDWRYYNIEYPGRQKFVRAVWETPEFVVLARPGTFPNDKFAPTDTATLEVLKTARLGIYTNANGAASFTKQLSVTDIGQRAIAHQVQPAHAPNLDSDEGAIDAVAGNSGLDVVLVRQRSLDVYRDNKPGAGKALEVIGTLPAVPNPAFLANTKLVSPQTIADIQAQLAEYRWDTAKTFAGGMVLLRNFSHYEIPKGDNR